MSEQAKEFARRVATFVDASATNYIVTKKKNAGSTTRQKFRDAAIEKWRHQFPHEANQYTLFLAWMHKQMTGSFRTGRMKNSAVPKELLQGMFIHNTISGHLGARGRYRAKGGAAFSEKRGRNYVTMTSVVPVPAAAEPPPAVEPKVDLRQAALYENKPIPSLDHMDNLYARYLKCVEQGVVPEDYLCANLMGISTSTVTMWRTGLQDFIWTEYDKLYLTDPRPIVDLAKLKEFVGSLPQHELAALAELLSEQ